MSVDNHFKQTLRAWGELYMHRSMRDFVRFSQTAGLSIRQMTTLIYQVARQSFTTYPAGGAGEPIQILCVGGTPEMEQRLERHGYTPVGPLKGFDVPLCELIMPAPETLGWFPTSAGKAYAAIIGTCSSWPLASCAFTGSPLV